MHLFCVGFHRTEQGALLQHRVATPVLVQLVPKASRGLGEVTGLAWERAPPQPPLPRAHRTHFHPGQQVGSERR